MKTNIVGWLYIIASPIFFLSFLALFVAPLVFSSGVVDDPNQPLIGLLALALGLFGLFWGSALRKHKKWSWYAGIVIIPLVAGGNAISLAFSFEIVQIVALLFNTFSVYALVSEKNLFFS